VRRRRPFRRSGETGGRGRSEEDEETWADIYQLLLCHYPGHMMSIANERVYRGQAEDWPLGPTLIAASERAGYSMLMIFAFISFRGFRIQVLRHLCRSVSSKLIALLVMNRAVAPSLLDQLGYHPAFHRDL
jgi:hypothetical protein